MMAYAPDLTEEQRRVLRVVRQQAADGYRVMSSTGLDAVTLKEVVERLQSYGLLRVEGDVSAERIGEAYLFVPPSSKGLADFLIGGSTAR